MSNGKMNSQRYIMLLAYASLFAALSYVGFQFFRIDIPVFDDKTAFHLGNTFVVLAALFLGGVWGGLSGAVGLTIADLTSGYATSAPKTFILKLLIGLIAGLIAHLVLHISRHQSRQKILWKTAVASSAGLIFNIAADPFVGYLYKKYIFGQPQEIASALAKMSSITTSVNALLSIIMSVLLYTLLRPLLEKAGLFFRAENDDGQKPDVDTNNAGKA